MSDIAISVQNLSKRYRIGKTEAQTTKRRSITRRIASPFQYLYSTLRQPTPDEVIWALKDVSFEVKRGEVLGVIGRNGAGKTTLLKILSRITEPTSGRAILNGRVGSLLEVGTGFHPELTGRENIYLSGAILGMKKTEIDRKFDEIIVFSGVEKFIDTPVKRYSSGMRVRLAFAVAAHLEPEILLIDEVLAVGDAFFQKKCLGKMEQVAKEGRTVIFVSHQMDMIRSLCETAICLNKGKIVQSGPAFSAVDYYLQEFESVQEKTACFQIPDDPSIAIQITKGKIISLSNKSNRLFDVFDKIRLEIEYTVREPIIGSIIIFELKRNGSLLFVSFDTDLDQYRIDYREPGKYRSIIDFPSPLLKPGEYKLTLGTGIANSKKIHHLEDILAFDVELTSKPSTFLSYATKRPGDIAVPLEWLTEHL